MGAGARYTDSRSAGGEIGWNHRDEMVRADKGGGGMVYFTYDSAGQRVRKVYEHSGLIEERIYLGGFEIYKKRVASSGVVTLERETLHVMDGVRRIALVETKTVDTSIPAYVAQTVTRLQMGNHLGSAALEVDAAGMVISYEEYHPYGTTAYQSASSAAEVSRKRYRYTGKERDEETGLYYHGARYCAPWLGRWTAADPAGLVDGPCLYAYARNNPVVHSDPTGREVPKPQSAQDRSITMMTDPQLHAHMKAMSPSERGAFLSAASGAFRTRAQAMRVKHDMKTEYTLDPVVIEGSRPGRDELARANVSREPVGLSALRQLTPDSSNSVFVQGAEMSGYLNGATAVGLGGAVIGAAAAPIVPAAGAEAALLATNTASRVGTTGTKFIATATGLLSKYHDRIVEFGNDALEGARQGAGPVEAFAGAGVGQIGRRAAQSTGTIVHRVGSAAGGAGTNTDLWLNTAGEFGKVGRRGNVLRLTLKGWDHIRKRHVKSTFDSAEAVGKDVSTVFTGTPEQYAALLEEAVANKAVVSQMTAAIAAGAKKADIRLTLRGQQMSLKVDVATSTIESFHAVGRIVNPALFEQRR